MSLPGLSLGATSFIFTTTRGRQCTAILKVVRSSNVLTATGRNSRLPAATTTTTTTSTTEETTREENTAPVNTSASPSPSLQDSILPSSTSATSTPAITSTSPPVPLTSTALAEESSAGQETYTDLETETSSETSIAKATASGILPGDAVATSPASTVANVQPSSANNVVQAKETPSIIPTTSSVPSTNRNSEAAKVAGGVLSGLVVLSLVGLFFWLWRRRRLNKRRSTLLTPLGPGPQDDSAEKAPYIINRRSIGPTPVFVKARAALGYSVKKIQKHISQAFSESSNIRLSPSNRPQSQGLLRTHGRNPSLVSTNGVKETQSLKESISNWWYRVASHVPISRRLPIMRNDHVVRDTSADSETTSERQARLQFQPDFLTLLAMDDSDLGREDQGQRRLSVSRQGSGQTRDKAQALQPLHLSEDNKSLRDNSTLSHISAIPAPLAAGSRPDNSFGDLHNATVVTRPPTVTAYRTEDRRRGQSWGQSVSIDTSASTTANTSPSRQPSIRTYRESIDSFTTHRNKFRSDPFDLERPELLGHNVGGVSRAVGVGVGESDAASSSNSRRRSSSSSSSNVQTAAGPRHPPSAHTRQESLGGSSRYSYSSSVVSLDNGWSTPGPDVGPASTGSGGTGSYGRLKGASAGRGVGRAI